MQSGTLIAFAFLVNLLLIPVAELGEILDQTQTAMAGWRKVLDLLDVPIDIVEAEPGVDLPPGPADAGRSRASSSPTATAASCCAASTSPSRPGPTWPWWARPGRARPPSPSCCAAWPIPTRGRILIDGVDLREVSPASRFAAIRMVPQDGFLFDATIAENVRMGRPDATDAEVGAAFVRLGLDWWLARLPAGLDTEVGERGENLSVGERQLVALARAQLADPGLLILDEATSAVDPETERALAEALGRAHRRAGPRSAWPTGCRPPRPPTWCSCSPTASWSRQGPHAELLAAGGRYSTMFESWLGNTQAA